MLVLADRYANREERRAAGIRSLPADLDEAIDRASESKVLRDALGHVHKFLIGNKREKWDGYKKVVRDLVRARAHLPIL